MIEFLAVLPQVMNRRDAGVFQAYLNERCSSRFSRASICRCTHQRCQSYEPLHLSTRSDQAQRLWSWRAQDSSRYRHSPAAARLSLQRYPCRIRHDSEFKGNKDVRDLWRSWGWFAPLKNQAPEISFTGISEKFFWRYQTKDINEQLDLSLLDLDERERVETRGGGAWLRGTKIHRSDVV